MSPDEAAAVLAYAAAADTRFTTHDAEQARARTQVWADLLSDVPAQFGLDYVRRYYAKPQDWPAQPGALRQAWLNHCKVVESKARYESLLLPRAKVLSELGVSAREEAKRIAAEAHQRGTPERPPSTPMRPVRDEVFGA